MANQLVAVSDIETDTGLTLPVETFHEDSFYGSATSRFIVPDDIGYLRAELRGKTMEYYIAMVKVAEEYRKQGIGRELVKLAVEEALTSEARTITATAVSPQSAAIFRRVFGIESLSNKSERPNSTFLKHYLK